MHPTVRDRLQMRAFARASGDVSLERACNADLVRCGYREEELETTVAEALPERAVAPKPKRGRPRLPRCEHDRIVGRCLECEDDGPPLAA